MSAKKDKEPAIRVVVTSRGIRPVAAQDAERLAFLSQGTEYELVPATKRSLPQLRTYWKALGLVVKATGKWADAEHLHEAIKLTLGYHKEVVNLRTGEVTLVADSAALSAMDHAEFCQFMDAAMELLAKLRALDLFCCAGGASMGLHRAGFEVVGVDIRPQPNYPFEFHQADALTYPLDGFDFIWASPPCQAFTAYKRRPNHVAPRENLIPQTRDKLYRSGIPYVIENVAGAPLENAFVLCGSMFGLEVRRHRHFEASMAVLTPPCNHDQGPRQYPAATNNPHLRRTVEVGVWRIPLAVQQAAMGIDWMTLPELSQAIPPAYAEFIGKAAIAYMLQERAAA